MIKNALEHPQWTLADWRGHGKSTGKSIQFFDKDGKYTEGIQFKNRREESKWSTYLNAVQKYLNTGDDSKLKKFKNVSFVDIDGHRHEAVINKETLNRLAIFNELPSGEDIYIN